LKILLIGSGGREHAIAWKLSQSPLVQTIFCAPGNGGTELEKKCINISLTKNEELLKFSLENNIDLTFVGPEGPLVEGIVDDFKNHGLKIFGPDRAGAKLEGSKVYAKEFMKKYGVKTAAYENFNDKQKALKYLKTSKFPIVIKADGLAAGKGVVICLNFKEAETTLCAFMDSDIFSGAGKTVVIEEYIEGVEISLLCITDGDVMLPLLSAKDHKRIFDGDIGPNTGGMGVIVPNPYCSEEILKEIKDNIINPTLKGIREENMDFRGIVFLGIMINKDDVYLLEYNVRMGDPETQGILPLMENDLAQLILCTLGKELYSYKFKWSNKSCCCVVATSEGYPGEYKTDCIIEGINYIDNKVFFAGSRYENGELKTCGGRVLSVVAVGENKEEARDKVYASMEQVKFKGIYYRNDIGKIL
jgi:phosphoribosylamine--glycine ligase